MVIRAGEEMASREYVDCFEEQYAKGAKFEMPAALLVAPYSYRTSTVREDCEEGVDVVDMFPRKSVRAITYDQENFSRFKYCFTIRTHTPYWGDSEFKKIWRKEGADALIYCWADEWKIVEWLFIDLYELADAFQRYHNLGTLHDKCKERMSPNGTTFITCDARDFPDEILIATSFNAGDKA
jgi:hypothetical protein